VQPGPGLGGLSATKLWTQAQKLQPVVWGHCGLGTRRGIVLFFNWDVGREIKHSAIPKCRVPTHCLLCVSGSHSASFQRAS
jgi:hypothetical protein